MSRLLQLILGCAVNCADKQQYIEAIMGMKEREQHIVMQVRSTQQAPVAFHRPRYHCFRQSKS